MTSVRFKNESEYNFALAFLNENCDLDYSEDRGTNTIAFSDSKVGRLFGRIGQNPTVVLPYRHTNADLWFIAGANRRVLEHTISQVRRFLVPTYASFPDGAPHFERFDPDHNELQRIGGFLYHGGYYRLVSPKHLRKTVIAKLTQWMDLEAQQPTLARQKIYDYCTLHNAFEAALSAEQWDQAAQALQELRRYHLTNATNLDFLLVQWLARQERWEEIWNLEQYPLLSQLRDLPRAVHAALLTAFHYSVLLPHERNENIDELISALAEQRARLGRLLNTHRGITQGAVVRTFGYLAFYEKNRAALDALLDFDLDLTTRRCLSELGELFPPSLLTAEVDPLSSIRDALNRRDYDIALRELPDVSDELARAHILLQIAALIGDYELASQALESFYSLDKQQQAQLHDRDLNVTLYLRQLEQISPPIRDWSDWFRRAQNNPNDAALPSALAQLLKNSDARRSWLSTDIRELVDILLSCDTTYTIVREALEYLTTAFINHHDFPRTDTPFCELWELLLMHLEDRNSRNETHTIQALRLADALLRCNPDDVVSIMNRLAFWFEEPIPSLADLSIEVFDLLAEFGLDGWQLSPWYRVWVEKLLGQPSLPDRANLETWLSYENWVQPGGDLAERLHAAITEVTTGISIDPIAQLPNNFHIAIFTLRERSAVRVKDILEARNPDIKVSICAEKDVNDQAISAARNADLPVIVWRCVTHAVTDGIKLYLKHEPVHPKSAGSSSLLREIEEAAKNWLSD